PGRPSCAQHRRSPPCSPAGPATRDRGARPSPYRCPCAGVDRLPPLQSPDRCTEFLQGGRPTCERVTWGSPFRSALHWQMLALTLWRQPRWGLAPEEEDFLVAARPALRLGSDQPAPAYWHGAPSPPALAFPARCGQPAAARCRAGEVPPGANL